MSRRRQAARDLGLVSTKGQSHASGLSTLSRFTVIIVGYSGQRCDSDWRRGASGEGRLFARLARPGTVEREGEGRINRSPRWLACAPGVPCAPLDLSAGRGALQQRISNVRPIDSTLALKRPHQNVSATRPRGRGAAGWKGPSTNFSPGLYVFWNGATSDINAECRQGLLKLFIFAYRVSFKA